MKIILKPNLFRLLCACGAWLLVGCSPSEDAAETTVSSKLSELTSASQADSLPPVVLDTETFDTLQTRVLGQVNPAPIDGLKVSLWAPEKLLADPVAINVDYQGRIWAAGTTRAGSSEFDIRGYPHWEIPSMGFNSVEDRKNFLRTTLSPERSDENTWLKDFNKDGSHDWRDLTVKKEKVVLLEDTRGDGRADQSRVFLEDFHSEVTDILSGVYYHNELDELFLAVSPSAWRVKDSDGDNRADSKQLLADGFSVHIGFGGHALSGMTLGPDGRIYYSVGDVSANITSSDGSTSNYPYQGVIVRSEPDGSNFEVFAHGLRNTHEFTFDHYGNLITVDNDGDHDGEYERLLYVIEGSDTGWRTNWQFGKYRDPKNNTYKVWMDERYYTPHFAEQSAHILPPIAPYHAGPTGMVYNPGTALSERWENHFFVAEFVGSAARSGINAFTLRPRGASFELATDESVFQGVLTTGLDFGPDGALYMADWVEGWGPNGQGRIWTMDATEGVDTAQRKSTQHLLQADFAALDAQVLTEHLQHPDMRVRQRAQLTLASRKDHQTLSQAAGESEHQLARIHAIWGLGQLARSDAQMSAPLVSLLNDEDAEIRAQVAKVLGDAAYDDAREPLRALLGDASLRVRLLAVQALGRIAHPDDQAAIITMLEANNDEDVYLRHAGATALARIGDADTLGALHSHKSEAVRVAAVVALKRLKSPYLAAFLNDASEFVVTNAARGISDDHLVTDALPALAQLLETLSFTNEPLLRRIINANLYLGGKAAGERLLQFALDQNQQDTLRAEAIAALAVWSESSVFDRVSGYYRGAVSHDADQVRGPLKNKIARLMADNNAGVRTATVKALAALAINSETEVLITALQTDTSASVRAAALQALFDLQYTDMGQAALTATQDTDSEVRMAALALLPRLNLPTEQVVTMHQLLIDNGTEFEQQAAYRSLANVNHASAHTLLADSLDKLGKDELAAEVQLDVIEAVKASNNADLIAALEAYESAKNPAEPMQMYREALYGGDAHEGMMLFRYDSSAQCIRCHMVGHRGAAVGPNLTHIGKQLTREQLLEALVDPNARVPAGHGRIAVTLNNGEQVSGLFAAESETSITIVDGGENLEINKADVQQTEYSGSGMPPMNYML
ncbi:MAG TPA: PVC-type heme-binding CxxCH protein, partial [Cellvibrionaceae bacterium]